MTISLKTLLYKGCLEKLLSMKEKNIVILIPTYEPDSNFVRYIHHLKKHYQNIIVVNDGSSIQYQSIFDTINQYEEVTLLSYKTNHGKGYALKYGYQFIQNHIPEYSGIITVDSDGQHSFEDVQRMQDKLKQNKHALILGCRDFSNSNVPFKSKLGNRITSFLFFILVHKWLADTQTGLRGFDASLTNFMLQIPGDRFEYETQVLISTLQNKIPINSISIQTIYINNNEHTHYKVFEDSLRIGKVLFGQITKFISSSLFSTFIDLTTCFFLLDLFQNFSNSFFKITLATLIARIFSMFINFSMNKKIVFCAVCRYCL